MDKTIELEGKLFKEMRDAMESVIWESEREKGKGQAFFLEFDGEFLSVYDKDGYEYFKDQVFDAVEFMSYYYYDIDEEERENIFLPVPNPFKARINIRCFKEILKVIRDEYEGDEGILKVRIFTDDNRTYFQLLNKKVCGMYGMNIIAECRFKISR